jgi:hypothetical protein
MSADNGIYILQTHNTTGYQGGYEYRVKELQAIENLNYDKDAPEPILSKYEGEYHSIYELRPEDKKHVAYQEAYRAKYYSTNPDVLIANARNMWKGCKVFTDKSSALLYASELLDKCTNDYGMEPEYGISFIKIPRVF